MIALQNINIDYEMLANACKYYKSLGYTQIETPWLVSERSALSTSPDGTRGCAFMTDAGQYLVCSAEHGFIEMMLRGDLQIGIDYYSVSPCFRDEEIDATHSKHFIKLELFSYHNNKNDAGVKSVKYAEAASVFHMDNLSIAANTTLTDIGVDLVDNNRLELGSYGYRQIEDFYVSYGTGLALPRAAIATKNMQKFYSPYDIASII